MAKKLEEKRVEGKKGAFVGFWTLLNWCVDQLDIILAGGVAVSPPPIINHVSVTWSEFSRSCRVYFWICGQIYDVVLSSRASLCNLAIWVVLHLSDSLSDILYFVLYPNRHAFLYLF